jgi:hypothetical protein
MTNYPSIGRVLRSNTSGFAVGAQLPGDEEAPEFGALVQTEPSRTGVVVYGVIADVTIDDDAFVRQLVAAGVSDPAIIQDQRRNRQVPVVMEIATLGYHDASGYHQRPAPRPPTTLDPIQLADEHTHLAFTATHGWLRLLLSRPPEQGDPLLAAAVRGAAQVRPPAQREEYLIEIGRELARWLADDPIRLDGILSQFH